jgi:hypothetical protein
MERKTPFLYSAFGLFAGCLIFGLSQEAGAEISILQTPPARITLPDDGRDAITADLNRDGKQDVVSIISSGDRVSVLLSDGQGGFAPAVSYTFPSLPRCLAAGDINGDGNTDIAVGLSSASGTARIRFCLGSANGILTPDTSKDVTFANTPYAVTLADLNADNKLDVITHSGGGSSDSLKWWFGNGDGTFQSLRESNFMVGGNVEAIRAADFNGDGKLDLALNGNDDFDVCYLYGNGTGGFGSVNRVTLRSRSQNDLRISDIDRDGDPDIVVAGANSAFVLYNRLGGFSAARVEEIDATPDSNPVIKRLICADFNEDGFDDAAICYATSASSGAVQQLLNRGHKAGARLQPEQNNGSAVIYNTGSDGENLTEPFGLVAADFSGDERPDVLTTNRSNRAYRWLNRYSVPRGIISGRVTVQGISNVAAEHPLTFTFQPNDGSPANVQTLLVPRSGYFFLSGLPPVQGELRVKGVRYLAAKRTYTPDVNDASLFLPVGDVNDDNFVDIADLLLLIGAYNQAAPAPGYSLAADLNGDGVVDIQDLLLLIGNFNEQGAL